MNKDWSKISLFFLFCIAGIGTLLRAMPLIDLPINYSNLVHAHSHIAFQGWVYTAVLLLVPYLFLSDYQIKKGRYALQFKITIPLIVAILIAFSIQGYGLYSILLSTLFQGMNYWFIFRFLKDTKSFKKKNTPLSFVKIGFWFGVLSSLAPYFVGYLSAQDLSDSETYEAAIYFFLHFQYNGWFLFTIIGIVFKIFERNKILYNETKLRLFLKIFTVSSLLTYAHSLLGMSFRSLVMAPAILGVLLQFGGIIILIGLVKDLQLKTFFQNSKWLRILMLTALASFVLKSLLQLIATLPQLQLYAFGNRSLIMAYMHLCLIGLITFFILSVLIKINWVSINYFSKTGYVFLYLGFLSSELFLLINGFTNLLPPILIVLLSGLMALGVLLILFNSKSVNTSITS